MLRRSSVVHVVDELARAQRRERQRVELEALLRRAGVGAVERARSSWRWCSRSLGAAAPGRAARSVSRRLRRRSWWSCSAIAGVGPARRFVLRAAAGDAGAAGVGAGDDRLGLSRRVRSACPGVWSVTRVPGGRCAATCACGAGSRSPSWTLAREHLAACLRAREVRVLRDRGDAARASVLVVRRDPFEGADSDRRGRRRPRTRCRCGSRSRSASTSRASRWRSSWSSATC